MAEVITAITAASQGRGANTANIVRLVRQRLDEMEINHASMIRGNGEFSVGFGNIDIDKRSIVKQTSKVSGKGRLSKTFYHNELQMSLWSCRIKIKAQKYIPPTCRERKECPVFNCSVKTGVRSIRQPWQVSEIGICSFSNVGNCEIMKINDI